MRTASIYLLIGLLAILTIQHSLGKPSTDLPDCTNFPDGYKIPGKNPPNFFFCHNGVAIPMFCPPGFNFCYNGQAGVCSKWCTNVDPPTTQAPAGCETTTSTTTVAGGGSTTTTTEEGNGTSEESGEETTTKSTTTEPENESSTTTPEPATTTTPEPETTTTSEPDINQCKDKPWGTLVPVKGDCSAFIICLRAKPVLRRCLLNLTFNAKYGICTMPKCKN